MKKGQRVKWMEAGDLHEPDVPGSGVTIADEVGGHILVAVDAPPNCRHEVIYCAVTWLKPE